jgi:polyisoprenoid-binding protein YceI
MKTLTLSLGALALAAHLSAAPKLPTGTYTLDPAHSKVGFEVVHLVVATVDGRFKGVSATVTLDSDPAKSTVEAVIDVASVDTGNEKRDGHLRSGDFFDVAKHPTMAFKSRSFKLKGEQLTVSGDLTLRGVTKPVTLEGRFRGVAADGYGNEKVGASLRGSINRKDFGVAWNAVVEAGPVVSDTVDLILNIEAGRALPKP